MTIARSGCPCLAALAAMLAAAAFGADEPQPPAAANAGREAERQDRVSGDLDRITGDFSALLDDLKSNQVFAEAGGDSL